MPHALPAPQFASRPAPSPRPSAIPPVILPVILPAIALALLIALLSAAPARAHELWIAARDWRVEPQGRIVADIVNGQKFRGHALPYLPSTTRRLLALRAGSPTAITPRAGDRPAIDIAAGPPGLVVLAYESAMSTLTYRDFDKFLAFVTHKDLPASRDIHLARGLPTEGFRETYWRFSKALVAVGPGAGADRALGFETELTALANPYTDALPEGLPVRLTYQGAPRPDAQIEVFDKAPDGSVTITTLRTDAGGVARVPLTPGHTYMLDAVVLRPPAADLARETGAVWESLWANLTFAHLPPP